jgi:protocatechuate 3,4-dioxygenase beta subunit
MRSSAVWLVVLGAVAWAAPTQAASTSGTLYRADGTPAADLSVVAWAPESSITEADRLLAAGERAPLASARSDAGGRFDLSLPPGRVVELAFAAAGGAGAPPAVVAVLTGEDQGGIVLPAAVARPRLGKVVDARGAPVSGALLVWQGSGGGAPDSASKSDAAGRVALPGADRQVVGVEIVHPDFAPLTRWLFGGLDGTPATTRFALDPGRLVRGTVVGSDGRPAAGAVVRVGPWRRATADSRGAFSLHAGPQSAVVVAELGGQAGWAPVGDGMRVVLGRMPVLSGTVVDKATGRPIEGARVTARSGSWGDDQVVWAAVANARGRYELTHLPPEVYSVSVAAPGYEFADDGSEIDLRDALVGNRDLVGTRIGRIRGRVVDGENHPLAGALVSLLDRDGLVIYTRSTQAGVQQSGGAVLSDAAGGFILPSSQAPNPAQVVAWRLGSGQGDWPAGRSEPFEVLPGATVDGVVVRLAPGVPVTVAVRDEAGQPLPGARVMVLEDAGRLGFRLPPGGIFEDATAEQYPNTGADGTVRLRLNPGPHDFGVTRTGFVTASRPNVLVEAGMPPLTVTLSAGVAITGRVVRPDGEGIPEVTVAAQSMTGERSATTDGAGRFRLAALPPGLYEVAANKPEDAIDEVRDVVAPTAGLRIVVPDGVDLSGQVVDETGAPVAELAVEATKEQEDGSWETLPQSAEVADVDGRFRLPRLPPGRVRITVVAAGLRPWRSEPLTLEVGVVPEPLAVRLVPGLSVTGRVRAATGGALAGVNVELRADDSDAGQPLDSATSMYADQMATPAVTTRDDGSYRLDGLAPGPTRLAFAKAGYLPQVKPVEVGQAGATLDVELATGRRLVGSVRDTEGRGLADAYVSSAGSDDADYQSTNTDEDGGFVLTGLAAGGTTVSVAKQGFRARDVPDVDPATVPRLDVVLERLATGVVVGTLSGGDDDWTARQVSIQGEDGSASGPIDAQGAFRVAEVPAGPVKVVAEVWGERHSRSATVDAEVEPGGETRVELRLDDGSTVSGRVTRAGEPVANANVRLYRRGGGSDTGTSTDADGRYELAGVEDGTWGIAVATRDRRGAQAVIEVAGATIYDVELDAATLVGRVVERDSGEGLGGVAISFETNDPRLRDLVDAGGTRTRSDGTFRVANMPAGSWTVVAELASHGQARATAEVPDSGEVEVELTLEQNDGLLVTLVDGRRGRAMQGWVVARATDGSVVYDGVPRREGDAVRLPIAAGSYLISASATGFATRTVPASVPSSGLRMTLSPGGTLVVRTATSSSRLARLYGPDGDEYVRCWCNRLADIWLEGRRTKLENIAAGAYTLAIFAADGGRQDYPVTVEEGRTAEVDVE